MSWELIGHGWAEALLRRHIGDASLRHAYLISGPAGIGKRTLALRFAQALNCERAEIPGGLCRQAGCRACQLTPQAAHPDLHLIAPDGSIKIDQIRELQAKAALAPYEGRWRVALLSDFHQATASAANALLKLLEEPPAKVILLLTAPDSESLPPTVVSRCEVLHLRPVEQQAIEAALRQRGLPAEQAEFLAVLAEGRPGRALALAEEPQQLQDRQQALAELERLLPLSRVGRIREVPQLIGRGNLAAQRERLLQLLAHWISLWRDLMLVGYQDTIQPLNADVFERFEMAVSQLPAGDRAAVLEAVLEAQRAIEANANLRLTLEGLMLEFPETEPLA